MRALYETTAVAALLFASACANDAVSGTQYDDLARTVGANIATPEGGGLVGAYADTATIASGGLPAEFSRDEMGLVVGKHFGLTYRYLVVCRSDAGIVLDGCGPTATTAVAITSWDGMLDMPSMGGKLRREGTWSFVGLRTPMAIASGTSWLINQTATFEGSRPVEYQLSDTADLMMVVAMDSHEMMGGGMRIDLAASRTDGSQPVATDVVVDVTFNPDHTAIVTLDDVHGYDLDLATGTITPR